MSKTKALKKKILELENRIEELVQRLELEQSKPSVVVERLYIDKILVDKIELTNNIGVMEIKELSGNLTIGANYSSPSASSQQVPKEDPSSQKPKSGKKHCK